MLGCKVPPPLARARAISCPSTPPHHPPGLARQYLLPMPAGRRKWEEPTHHPAIDPHSQARTRGGGGVLGRGVYVCVGGGGEGAGSWVGNPPSGQRLTPPPPPTPPCTHAGVQLIAARRRPDNLPVHELLYNTAGALSARKDEMRKQAEERELAVRRVCLGGGGGGQVWVEARSERSPLSAPRATLPPSALARTCTHVLPCHPFVHACRPAPSAR